MFSYKFVISALSFGKQKAKVRATSLPDPFRIRLDRERIR